MPLHLIKNFYIAKDFIDSQLNGGYTRLPALKAKDLAIVLAYMKLLTPTPETTEA